MADSIKAFFSNFVSKSKHFEDELFNSDRSTLKADKHCCDPNKAWRVRKRSRVRHKILNPVDSSTPCKEGCVRFVCISDTHTIVEKAALDGVPTPVIPDGDVLLHTGDFTMYGTPDEVALFNKYMGTLPHKHKIVIAGNHDMTFDLDFIARVRSTRIWRLNDRNYEDKLKINGVNTVHEMLTNCVYLQDSMVRVHGFNIYGSPWQPGSGSWGFNRKRGVPLLEKWTQIPDDTDILLTHGPPCGYGDDVGCSILQSVFDPRSSKAANHVGCVDLLNTIQSRVKPKYHIFGHIHEGHGMSTDGTTNFINASICDENYRPINKPIVFDLPLTESQPSDRVDSSTSQFKWLIRTKLPKTHAIDDDMVCFEDEEFDIEDSSDDSSSHNHAADDDGNDEDVCFKENVDTANYKSYNKGFISDITSFNDNDVNGEDICFKDRSDTINIKSHSNTSINNISSSGKKDDDDEECVCFQDNDDTTEIKYDSNKSINNMGAVFRHHAGGHSMSASTDELCVKRISNVRVEDDNISLKM